MSSRNSLLSFPHILTGTLSTRLVTLSYSQVFIFIHTVLHEILFFIEKFTPLFLISYL